MEAKMRKQPACAGCDEARVCRKCQIRCKRPSAVDGDVPYRVSTERSIFEEYAVREWCAARTRVNAADGDGGVHALSDGDGLRRSGRA